MDSQSTQTLFKRFSPPNQNDCLTRAAGHDMAVVNEMALSHDLSALLSEAVASTVLGIVVADPRLPDCPITYCNPSFTKMTGYTSEEVLGKNCRFLQGAETDSKVALEIRKVIGLAQSCDVTLLNYRKDGSTFWNRLVLSPVKDDSGEVTHYVGVQHDVTAEMNAHTTVRASEQALKVSEESLSYVLESSRIGTWDIDLILHTSRRSTQHDQCFGYRTPLEQWNNETFLAHVHPDERLRVISLMQSAAAGNGRFNYEYRVVWPDQSVHWLHSIGHYSRDEVGNLVRASGITMDVSDRHYAEDALQQSQGRLLLALESSHLGTYYRDLETREYLEVSDACKRHFGFSATESFTYEDVLLRRHPEDRERVREAVDRAESNLEDFHVEYRITWPDATLHWISSHGRIICSSEGAPIGLIGMTQDITERKIAEQLVQELNESLERRVNERTVELQAANHELEAFAYSVSHDLRAPLRSIDGFSQALLEDYSGQLDKTGTQYLERVRHASQRMSVLIDDLLGLSRVTRTEMRRQSVDISAIVQSVCDDLLATQPQREVEFIVQQSLWIHADPRLTRIMVENLLGNAWKYTGKNSTARIEFGQTENNGVPCYYVRDDGAGFDMEYGDRLFKPFQRLHTMSEFEGTGIGLATVHRILMRHGGRVWAEAAVSKGATFYFTF